MPTGTSGTDPGRQCKTQQFHSAHSDAREFPARMSFARITDTLRCRSPRRRLGSNDFTTLRTPTSKSANAHLLLPKMLWFRPDTSEPT